jgi:hypothetical protein
MPHAFVCIEVMRFGVMASLLDKSYGLRASSRSFSTCRQEQNQREQVKRLGNEKRGQKEQA